MYEALTKYLLALETVDSFLGSDEVKDVDEDGNITILGYKYTG